MLEFLKLDIYEGNLKSTLIITLSEVLHSQKYTL